MHLLNSWMFALALQLRGIWKGMVIRMRSKLRADAFMMMTLLVILSVFLIGQTESSVQGYAQETVNEADITRYLYAGAAEILEVEIVPTEEEIRAIMNAWKEPGSIVMADVNDSVNVRLEPDENSERVGKLYKDCGGFIIEYTDEWTKIESGELVGWVRNDYLMFGDEAEAEAESLGTYQATVVADSLRVRKEASTESGIYGLVAQGEVYEVIEEDGDWIVIDFEDVNGYVNVNYVEINYHIDSGETMEQIEEREAAERAAAREANRIQLYETYVASDISEVELLGALIQCEAGNQPYEGKVAVGAVVMNRVRSGAYPNTIYGVISASGQFSPAGNGALTRRIQNGISESCIQAAQEAINGYSNVGDATHFRRVGAHEGIEIGGHVFW